MQSIGTPGVGASEPPPFVRLASHPVRWRLLRELVRSDRTVRELMALIDEPQSLVSYHLRLLREGELVTARRSSADRRDSYYAIDLAACREALQHAGGALHSALQLVPARPESSRAHRATSPPAGAVLVHRQQRAITDRRGASRSHVGRDDPRGRAPAAIRSRCTRMPCECMRTIRDRHQRTPHEASRRVRIRAVRHGDHTVRPRSRGLPDVSGSTRARPLERSGSGARGLERPRVVPRVRTHGNRARDPHRLPVPHLHPHAHLEEARECPTMRSSVSATWSMTSLRRSRSTPNASAFEVLTNAAPAFADVKRGNLRLLLSGPKSSAGRPMSDGVTPGPGGWNRIHLIVDDIDSRRRPPARWRRIVSQRHRRRPRREADPARRPVRQLRRAVPTGRPLTRRFPTSPSSPASCERR